MADLFFSSDVQRILRNKKIVIVGDSVYRCMYKDLVLFLQNDRLLERGELKEKGEEHCNNDNLIYRTALNNGPEFTEIREYQSADGYHLVQYYFVTRAYNDRVELMLKDFEKEPPDVVIMNSCQWDLTRYRHEFQRNQGVRKNYIENLNILMTRLHAILKPTSMFVWCTALPLASTIVGGFLKNDVKFNSEPLRIFILEGNYEAAQVVTGYGFDVLDMHYYMRSQVHQREKDGVHWTAVAHRHMTELIITFLLDSWGLPFPDSTVEKLKKAERLLEGQTLPHLNIDGRPTFLKSRLRRLEAIAASITTTDPTSNKNQENGEI